MARKSVRKRRKFKPLRFFVLILILATLIASGAALGLVFISVKDLPAWNDKVLVPSTVTQIYDKDGKQVSQIGLENRVQVSIKDVPQNVQNAFLAAEDHYFYEHHGIRIQAIIRAALNDALHFAGINRQFQGGSTITQQLVKLTFLTPDQNLKRKIQEVILSFKLERRYSKKEILEMYLNRIYLGEGSYGIQAASQTYFGKDVGDLTVAEAATLAGLNKSPNYYSPLQNKDLSISRRNQVLKNMLEYNFIDQETYDKAISEKLTLKQNDGKHDNNYPYPYFVDYITNELVDKFGEETVFKGGLKVYTTLDPKIQNYAEKAMSNPNNFPASKKNADGIMQPQGAMVIMDPDNGEIRAIVGGREHTHMRSLNRATMSPRQPGSSIKPILAYGPAIELKGMGPASIIDDAPVRYSAYGNYSPKNFDGVYRGLITMRTALTKSINVVAVKLFTDYVTIPEALKFARRMNIDLDPTGPAMALGGLRNGVTPMQMTAAYAAFDNHGIYNDPVAILKVEDQEGNILFESGNTSRRVMKETTSYLMTSMMESVVQAGTGTGAQIGRPVAGKTGTTDEGKDIWFAGYTPDLVGVVWIGYDTPTKMPQSFGGIYPARIWKEVMQQAHKDIPVHNFIKPAGIVTATVDDKSGLLPGPNTPPEDMVTDIFAAGTVPTETDNVHVLTEVCATTGKLPNQYCPDRITRVMLKLPYTVPKYVLDYNMRVPTEICDVHGPVETFGNGKEGDNNSLPWPDLPSDLREQDNGNN
ncbi:transglycosylase domain-containing protein [Desulfotruncus alcoholivorax]|uniref:transglycosylase domain-containing protein n=1 Tax=Desulfotruncus alcoholivorax TaxID=265477 RepID=UPI000429CD43|nr:penicillin-binding protein 1A [Desulfotruncus alcoholivorax]